MTRAQALERHLENDRELQDALRTRGFQAFDAATLPYWEQTERVGRAQLIVMVHGAGNANLVHRIGLPTGIVELFPGDPDFARPYGAWASRSFGFAYRALVGSALDADGGFVVDRAQLEDAVDAVAAECAS